MNSSRLSPFCRRASWHDYHSRCIYMITLGKASEVASFSRIKKDERYERVEAIVDILPIGRIILNAVLDWYARFPELEHYKMTIMPDHIHMLFLVKETTEAHLGWYIHNLKSACTASLQVAFPYYKEKGISAFLPNYNDKIVYERGRVKVLNAYIRENPRKYLIRKLYAEYFANQVILGFSDGERYEIYGNLNLLEMPFKSVVRYSSKYSEKQRKKNEKEWEEIIRSGGVLISPFIHPHEREVRDKGIAGNASLIYIFSNGLPDKFSPRGYLHPLCAEGRLLIVAPLNYDSRKEDLKRGKAMAANAVAEKIMDICSRRDYHLCQKK